MPGFDRDSLVGDVLDVPEGRSVLQRHLAGLVNSPLAGQLRFVTVDRLLGLPMVRCDADALLADLAGVDGAAAAPKEPEPRIVPRSDYEDDSVARGSATASYPGSVARYGRFELVLAGPSHGNPFTDVELSATFAQGDAAVTCGGFYDGDGRHVVRFLPLAEGEWRFVTTSTARSLDGIEGTVVVGAAAGHGPVRVDGRPGASYHFAHADGTRHVPLGTTCYAWTHQPEHLQRATLATLAAAPFTKLRLCVFPKSYLFNTNDPDRYPYERAADGSFDHTRFDPDYWRHLEGRIDDLAALGIEADLILFHAYDRWGFSAMSAAADDRYVAYAVRRLQAFPNVWWALANEYDLVWSKTTDDWERIAGVVGANDPVGHLTSIHNCFGHYDHTRPWVTHASVQRVDVYRTAENVTEWRREWGKPVVVDECAYEGNIDQGWGNITGEEMTRRFWEGAVRGGYVGHGETYLNDREELWWSKGGELVGSSPARIAFLQRVTEESPTGYLEPRPGEWDVPWCDSGSGADDYLICYFGFNQPSFRDVHLPEGRRYDVDILDTWNMTVERLPQRVENAVRVPLPARPFMAVRFVVAER